MIKHFDFDAYPALMVGILCSVLLKLNAGYTARSGLLAMLPAIGIMVLTAVVFAALWPYIGSSKVFGTLFAVLLVYAAALETLRLWQLYAAAYSGAVMLLSVAAAVLLPVVYLRRMPAIAQTANATLVLLALVAALLVITVAPQLRAYNLQAGRNVQQALAAQLAMPPELLLIPLYCRKGGTRRLCSSALTLTALLCAGDGAIHLLLELFYGAATMQRTAPVHAVAASGMLSIFNRMEWLQLLLWTLAVAVKIGLYIFSTFRLLSAQGQQSGTVPLTAAVPLCLAIILICCWLKNSELSWLFTLKSGACWALALLGMIGGAAACAFQKIKSA